MSAPPDNDEGRPGEERPPVSINGDVTRIPDAAAHDRCRRCRHPLSAARSVLLGIGPHCRKAESAVVLKAVS